MKYTLASTLENEPSGTRYRLYEPDQGMSDGVSPYTLDTLTSRLPLSDPAGFKYRLYSEAVPQERPSISNCQLYSTNSVREPFKVKSGRLDSLRAKIEPLQVALSSLVELCRGRKRQIIVSAAALTALASTLTITEVLNHDRLNNQEVYGSVYNADGSPQANKNQSTFAYVAANSMTIAMLLPTDHEITINTGADLVKEVPVTTTTTTPPAAPIVEAPVVTAKRVEMPKTKEEYRNLKAANKTLHTVHAKYGGKTGLLSNEELVQLDAKFSVNKGKQRLEREAVQSFLLMAAHFEREFGRPLQMTDSYRDLHGQEVLAGSKPHLAAPAGTSFHGTGIAIDFASNINNFDSAEHNWMREHAPKYGWIHPPWAQRSGEKPEPWHWEFLLPVTVVAPPATETTPSVVTVAPTPAPVETMAPTTSGATSPPEPAS